MLVNGEIAAYIEDTGTGLLAILNLTIPAAGATPAADAAATSDSAGPVDIV